MHLDPLIRPRSVAVLGASDGPTIGRALVLSLDRLGYDGQIYPVNPKYESVLGRTCYPKLADLPEPPDVVAFCVSRARIPENFEALAARGGRAAVIYDGGFAEQGEDGKALQARITGLCAESGIALCGPNCMGILNPHGRSTTYMQEVRDAAQLPGNVGLISQSGSICIGMLADLRRFGFSLVISSGNEAVVGAAAYLEHLVEDENTRVIALFAESIREPERFVAALDRAADMGKPVVVLKVGRSERARRAITTHTGGLAGESRVFSALLKAHRAIEVTDLDELTEVLVVCQGRRWPAGRRMSVITGSGGQAELILDVAVETGLDLPPLSRDARAEAERVIGPLTGDGNPLDAWGNGNYRVNMTHALAVLNASADLDAVVMCNDNVDDQPLGNPDRAFEYVDFLIEASAAGSKPNYLMSTRVGVVHSEQARRLAAAGIPVISGSRQGLGAIDRVARYLMPQAPLRARPELPGCRIVPGSPRTIHEFDAKRLLAAAGVPVTQERLVTSLEEAKAAAREIGYPMVLKVVSADIPHKSDLGLVKVGIADAAALERAWADFAGKIETIDGTAAVDGFLVQEMVRGGVEVFAGIARDTDFGLSIACGMGGVAIEILRDFAIRPLPLRDGDAEAMIAETQAGALLGPVRGSPPSDVASLADCIYALAAFAEENRAMVEGIDINPIKVLPQGQGCVVVDALIITTCQAEE